MCPITGELMVDPVKVSDGHTYERSAIEAWLETKATSPRTGEPLGSRQLESDDEVLAQVLTIREMAAVAADDQRAAADDQRAAAALEPPDASAAARAEEEGDEGDEDVERRARAVGARSVGAPSTPTSTPTTSTSTIPSLPPVSLSPDCWWLRQLVLHSYASGGLRPSASSTSPASSAHGGDGGGARGGWEREEEVVNVAAASGRAQALDDPSHNGALPPIDPSTPGGAHPILLLPWQRGQHLALSSLPAAVSGGGSVSDSVGGLTSSLLLHAWLEAPTAHLAATSAALAVGSPAAPPEWSPWTNAWGWQVRPTAQRFHAIMTLSRSLVASRSASWAVPPPRAAAASA